MTNRNSNAHFELAPQVAIERSTFNRDCNIHTSFNVSDLVPFYVDEVLPGDTFQIQTSKVARLQTLIAPVMDNLYLDTYYFFVPNRLVWDDWEKFMGEDDPDGWNNDFDLHVPKVVTPEDTGWTQGSIADYMGIPTKIPSNEDGRGFSVNALPFRAYCKIYNDWFRDENVMDPLLIYKDSVNRGGSDLGQDNPGSTCLGGKVVTAFKYHDYFTSCLPKPFKGQDIPFIDGIVPVKTSGYNFSTDNYAMRFQTVGGQNISGNVNMGLIGDNSYGEAYAETTSGTPGGYQVKPSNLYVNLADLSKFTSSGVSPNNGALTINSLRQAFQIQRMLEKDARGGTRYIEQIKAHFGVTSPDARLQRAEYLGGNRMPLNIEQVVNTTTGSDGLMPGDVSGWSQTNDVNFDVDKSFTEHGFVIGLMCARYDHTYQQGLERFWSRESRYDYYWPALAHLGEQAVKKRELYCTGWSNNDNATFGYQEAWAEYRYKPNYVTGAMRSNVNNSLDIWHFADNYTSSPILSKSWMRENKSNVDRALTVKSSVENQIFMDIYVKNKCTRPMPLYSIPGYIDHF